MKTMTKIETVLQLEAEIKRLRATTKEKENKLRSNFKSLREEFTPRNILVNAFSSATGIRVDNKEILKEGVAFAISLILQRFVLKSESKLEEKVYVFLDNIFEKIKSFLGKHTSYEAKREERKEDKKDSNA